LSGEENALLREYEKVIDLWIGEDRSAWELVSIYMAVQGGLASVSALLYTQSSHDLASLRYLAVFLIGAVSSFAWFFILWRAKMRRENWFLVGLATEQELADRRVKFYLTNQFHSLYRSLW
jgi:hypothetical protein